MTMNSMENSVLEKAQIWAADPEFDLAFRQEITGLLEKNDEKELIDRFYKDLEFGTGGLRGLIGAGSNRMNIYTVRKATQGMADYLLEVASETQSMASVAIAYDSRRFSKEFSREAAGVLAANGVKVYLYPELRPVPMLSFAVRELKTTAGIVITASHNPPEYNGYKVYWSDGCQVTAPHDSGIIGKANQIVSMGQVKWISFESALADRMVEMIPASLEESYFNNVVSLALGETTLNKNFGVVYTPLHGAGNYPVREILKRRGFENVSVVKAQETPDGNFPTVSSPNPEEPTALKLAQETAGKEDQLIIGTDPDADRLGVLVRDGEQWHKINGNQIGQLLLEYYLRKLREANRLPDNGVYITTIVTSGLGSDIAKSYGISARETLTGFKYIAGLIRELESKGEGEFLFGTEESHGYLAGSFVRDKDGVIASMLFCELCAELHQQGITVLEQLDRIHRTYGYHTDSLVNKVIKGVTGVEKIAEIMETIRKSPPKTIGKVAVVTVRDYLKKEIIDCQTGEVTGKTTLPASNVLAFFMADGSRITMRPSGTEPKIKFYFNLKGDDAQSLDQARSAYEIDFMRLIDQI